MNGKLEMDRNLFLRKYKGAVARAGYSDGDFESDVDELIAHERTVKTLKPLRGAELQASLISAFVILCGCCKGYGHVIDVEDED